MKKLLHEPLVHFLALGGLLFAFFAWRGGGAGSSGRIVVTPGVVEHLTSGFTRTWQRPPAQAELKGLVDDWVKEEIASREAAALGLDRDDTVVRRRLRQKLEDLVEDAGSSSPPSDAELSAWLKEHPDAFRSEPRLAFRQVFVSRDKRGAKAKSDAAAIRSRLEAQGAAAAWQRLGDPTLLPAEQPLAPLGDVSRVFGGDLARALMEVEPGRWAGPIESPFGLHVVFVERRVAAAPPALDEIRPAVEREVVAARRKRGLDAFYEKMLGKYTVTIQGAGPPAEAAARGGPR